MDNAIIKSSNIKSIFRQKVHKCNRKSHYKKNFCQGYSDCLKGIIHKSNSHPEYDEGYSFAYEEQEMLSMMNGRIY